jgi:exodeoxyribonuclease V gamma subunit
MLHLYTSNRLERLFDKLCDVVKKPLASPLNAQTIMVQSRGMQHWLSMQLAQRFGIAANNTFPFPNAFINGLVRDTLPTLGSSEPLYDKEVISWRLMALLQDYRTHSGFEEIDGYLKQDASQTRLHSLACIIADIFDQYLVYRPQLIQQWESSQQVSDTTELWQAKLWRALHIDHAPVIHRLQALHRCLKLLTPQQLGERLCVFGLSALPPLYMDFFAALAEMADIHLFLLSPCAVYWADARDRRFLARQAARTHTTLEEFQQRLYYRQGNALLASWGVQIQHFCHLLPLADEHDCYEPPRTDSVLSQLHHAIYNDIDALGKDFVPQPLDPQDSSLQIHRCHSRMREVEVLRDELLALFEQGEHPITPRDVVVMAPDIEQYVPYIEAVFDTQPFAADFIPFSIADRAMQTNNQAALALVAILELLEGRFGAQEIVSLLEHEIVRTRLGIDEKDAEECAALITEAAIRWGIDGRHKEQDFSLPSEELNTWRYGLRRLFLGYALSGDEDQLFEDVLPCKGVEGHRAQLAGVLADVVDTLAEASMQRHQARTVELWCEMLQELMDALIDRGGSNGAACEDVVAAIAQIGEKSSMAGYDRPVSYATITAALREQLAVDRRGGAYLSCGVTFCNFLPMRGIPFEVVCILGLNDGEFPRIDRTVGFNLITRQPRPGDRTRRVEDRFLFLEALLSARSRFYLSYVGSDIREGSELPPSVLLSELCDYLDTAFQPPPGYPSASRALTIRHFLQPFNEHYFDGTNPRLFSYSREQCNAAAALRTQQRQSSWLFAAALSSAPPRQLTELSVDDFSRFFSHPVRYFLSRRLGVWSGPSPLVMENEEPAELDNLQRYKVRSELFRLLSRQTQQQQLSALLRATGQLPHGAAGSSALTTLTAEAQDFLQRLGSFDDPVMEPIAIDITLDDLHITGQINNICKEYRFVWGLSRVRQTDVVALWVEHLLLNLHLQQPTLYCARTDTLRFAPAASSGWALNQLQQLGALYREGLSRPLRFFPESSYSYAQQMVKEGVQGKALAAAAKAWDDTYRGLGERYDIHNALVFGDIHPFDEAFMQTALAIFEPLLNHQSSPEESGQS